VACYECDGLRVVPVPDDVRVQKAINEQQAIEAEERRACALGY
jgi:hypothetical protein